MSAQQCPASRCRRFLAEFFISHLTAFGLFSWPRLYKPIKPSALTGTRRYPEIMWVASVTRKLIQYESRSLLHHRHAGPHRGRGRILHEPLHRETVIRIQICLSALVLDSCAVKGEGGEGGGGVNTKAVMTPAPALVPHHFVLVPKNVHQTLPSARRQVRTAQFENPRVRDIIKIRRRTGTLYTVVPRIQFRDCYSSCPYPTLERVSVDIQHLPKNLADWEILYRQAFSNDNRLLETAP